jgi:hypothetical protein
MVCHAPRQLTLATLLLTGAAGLATSVSVRGAPAATLAARPHWSAGVAMTETSLKQELTMPARWKNVHDCERPSRWREQLDDEDCKIRLEQLKSGDAQVVYDVGGSSSGADSGYSDLVPNLVSMEDFLSASRGAARQNKMLVVKFYSMRCRACLRIAANYRRLARKYGDEISCYEMEQHAAGRELLELLSVDQVPTIQIFDGAGINRLANLDCQPAQFKQVEQTIAATIEERMRRQGHLDAEMAGAEMARDLDPPERGRGKSERLLDVLLPRAQSFPPPGPGAVRRGEGGLGAGEASSAEPAPQ